jgi:hypothetical protein
MREIPLTHGEVALVDDEDFEWLSKFSWRVVDDPRNNTLYAAASPITMHRIILGSDGAEASLVDHENGNGLDNRRENLRMATASQNQGNRRLNRNSTSGYKGVSRRNGRWTARIKMKGRSTYLGTWDTPEEAAEAYDSKAREYFGEFAHVNFH